MCLIYLNLDLPHYLSLLCQTPPDLSLWKQMHQSLQQEQYSYKRTRVEKLILSSFYSKACLRLNIVTRFIIESSQLSSVHQRNIDTIFKGLHSPQLSFMTIKISLTTRLHRDLSLDKPGRCYIFLNSPFNQYTSLEHRLWLLTPYLDDQITQKRLRIITQTLLLLQMVTYYLWWVLDTLNSSKM